MTWRTIDSAPRDGTPILGYGIWAGEINGPDDEPSVEVIRWNHGRGDYFDGAAWECTGDAYGEWMLPTHWQPLPAPPEDE